MRIKVDGKELPIEHVKDNKYRLSTQEERDKMFHEQNNKIRKLQGHALFNLAKEIGTKPFAEASGKIKELLNMIDEFYDLGDNQI